MKSLRDAVLLLALILLAVSIRITPSVGPADLVPEAKAAGLATAAPSGRVAQPAVVNTGEIQHFRISSVPAQGAVEIDSTPCPHVVVPDETHGENGRSLVILVDVDNESEIRLRAPAGEPTRLEVPTPLACRLG